ncbi:MAG: glutamine--fructose-6-phosphate transaminase (isomerizing), partial [Clostridia bacterium]|nr:glutamine--fructose-6-phosphate transaminase (isomerizing) [Clostridia bacterium]
LGGLHALEYRGYDSSGIAFFEKNGQLRSVKSAGKIACLENKLANEENVNTRCVIGHTRWATHGAPTDVNSHPHGNGRLMLVHNGIIENCRELKLELEGAGYAFQSDTDTEAAALLIDSCTREGDRLSGINRALGKIRGSYAFGILFADEPGVIWAARQDSPLIVGLGENENLIASDVTAILAYTRRYLALENGDVAKITRDAVTVYRPDGSEVKREPQTALWDLAAAMRGGHAHFMHKEIYEEPDAVKKTLFPRISDGLPDFSPEGLSPDAIRSVRSVRIVACGTAYHAGLAGAAVLERVARVRAYAEIASEFRYRNPVIEPDELVILISQSGETADTIAALRLAKAAGAFTLGIVNTVGSTVARESDAVLYTYAGPEIAVASTKAYTVQTALMTLFGIWVGYIRGSVSETVARGYVSDLTSALPNEIKKILAREKELKAIAAYVAEKNDMFFIGRLFDASLAAEASLKLKEISYIHSEAYAAGELKHGTISLIEPGTPVVALSCEGGIREKMVGNMKEVVARGANLYVFAAGKDGVTELSEMAKVAFLCPDCPETIAP